MKKTSIAERTRAKAERLRDEATARFHERERAIAEVFGETKRRERITAFRRAAHEWLTRTSPGLPFEEYRANPAAAWRIAEAGHDVEVATPNGGQIVLGSMRPPEGRKVPVDAIESFIDERLAAMRERPRMFGEPFSLECECFVLIEVYLRFCRESGDWKDIAPSGDVYQKFARKMHPKRPGPMTMGQWFTDKEWGDKKTRTFENEGDLLHWAGQQIVEFFIAWKKDLAK